jgi:hypothetical protein
MNPALLVAVAAAAVVAVLVLVAVLVTRASRRRWQAQIDALAARLDDLTQPPATEPATEPVREPREFTITSLPPEPVPGAGLEVAQTHLSAGQFASVAAGESLVRVLSFGYGVRRALSAENRNRIRFEMRREVKRVRRQRRRDLKEAKRHLRHVTNESEEDAA